MNKRGGQILAYGIRLIDETRVSFIPKMQSNSRIDKKHKESTAIF